MLKIIFISGKIWSQGLLGHPKTFGDHGQLQEVHVLGAFSLLREMASPALGTANEASQYQDQKF